MLTIIDEYTRQCLSIQIQKQIKAPEVFYKLSELFLAQGLPDHIRSNNGSEFSAKSVRSWHDRMGVKTLFIEPGSPWKNGYIESFDGKVRDELLNGKIFNTIL